MTTTKRSDSSDFAGRDWSSCAPWRAITAWHAGDIGRIGPRIAARRPHAQPSVRPSRRASEGELDDFGRLI